MLHVPKHYSATNPPPLPPKDDSFINADDFETSAHKPISRSTTHSASSRYSVSSTSSLTPNHLCHICGDKFSKAALPGHQRRCMKRHVKPRSSSSASSFSLYNGGMSTSASRTQPHYPPMTPQKHDFTDENVNNAFDHVHEEQAPVAVAYYPCTNCKSQVPAHTLAMHLRTCKGGVVAQNMNRMSAPSKMNTTAPATTLKQAPKAAPMKTRPPFVVPMPEESNYEEEDVYEEPVVRHEPVIMDRKKAMLDVMKKQKLQQLNANFGQAHVTAQSRYVEEHHHHHEDDDDEEENDHDNEPAQAGGFYSPVNTQVTEEYRNTGERKPCRTCGRKFVLDALERHVKICTKVSKKQRKVFDMTKARVQGTELEKYVLNPAGKGKGSQRNNFREDPVPGALKTKKSNWRAKHEQFINMVRAARNPSQPATRNSTHPSSAPSKGSMRSQPSTSASLHASYPPAPSQYDSGNNYATNTYDDGLVPCPVCTRRFNEHAAERHIPICQESARKQQIKRGSSSNGKSKPAVSKPASAAAPRATMTKRPSVSSMTAKKPSPPSSSSMSSSLFADRQEQRREEIAAKNELLKKRTAYRPPPPKTRA